MVTPAALLRALRSSLGIAATRGRFEEGMSSELRFHLDAYADDLIRRGVPRAEAERRARLEFGSIEALKDDLRAARGQRLFDELSQDIRYACRRFRGSRGPAVAAVLALGIGVNLAVFSVIHASLLRPLPHPDPDRLVAISSRQIESGREHLTAPLDFFDFERRSTSFDRMAAYYPPGFTITGNGDAERVSGARASAGIFAVFGVQPALGRGFLPAEDRAGTPAVAVISHSLWVRRYRADPAAIGQAILLSGRPYTLVGVLPEGFHSPAMWPRMPEVWVPIGLDPNVERRDGRMLRVLGRLRPGVSVAQARAEMDVIAKALEAEYPAINAGTGATVTPLLDQLTRDVRPSLFALAAAVMALLLVACGNAAGLLVGSGLERRHEFATRLAIGASRGRIIRQIVAENLLVGLLAAGVGFGLALYAADFLVGAATAAGVPRAGEIRVGWPTFAAGVLLSIACTTGCALVVALETTRARDLRVVRGAGAATPRRNRARSVLIGVEAALSLALLVGAALLVRSFYELQITKPGFEPEHLLTARLSAPQARYPAGPALAGFFDRAVERVRALPGVEAASVVDWLPVSGFGASASFRRTRNAAAPDAAAAFAELRVVGPDYFQTMRVPVAGGRPLDRRDVDGAPLAVVVNESLARAQFGSADPIGEHLTLDRGGPLEVEIVGVVGDVRELALRIPAGPTIYAPKTQSPWMRHETRDLVVRSTSDPASLAPAIQTVLRELEPTMPRPAVQRMEDVIGGALARPGFHASAVAGFALTAVLLVAFGIYGTVTSAVTERRRELGVRLALGASRGNVLIRAARYGTLPTIVGLAAGVPLGLAAGRILRQQLYGVEPTDWPTILLVSVFMGLVAVAAAFIPAMQATRIDPAGALRHQDAS
jgi:putative ABC transport system permease protein